MVILLIAGYIIMEFKQFFDILHSTIGSDVKEGEFCRELFLAICTDEGNIQDELMNLQFDTFRRYVSRNNINSIAAKVFPHIDKDNFKDFIEKAEYHSQEALMNELASYYPDLTYKDLPEVCANCFERIIQRAASNKVLSRKNLSNDALDLDDCVALHTVGMMCPLCGEELIKKKNGKSLSRFRKVDVFPDNITSDLKQTVNNLKQKIKGNTYFDGKVMLCNECANDYIEYFDLEKCKIIVDFFINKNNETVLVDIQKRALLDQDIVGIINALNKCEEDNLSNDLRMEALEINKKILPYNSLLRRDVKNHVLTYYKFIENRFKELDKIKSRTSTKIAHKIQGVYLELAEIEDDQEIIFYKIVEWLMATASTNNRTACVISASFFVQNCEVFDEIS